MEFIGNLFTLVIYQPFFNLLVAIYWALLQIPALPHKDMGIAVIIFTIALRLLMMPLTLRATRTEKERNEIEAKIKDAEAAHSHDPVAQKQHTKAIFKERPSMLISEGLNLLIQIGIALMLWRIFAKGLVGEDIHLLYPFTPHPPTPYNLTFLNQFDLTHPDRVLNIIQTILIFILETVHLLTSPYPYTRKDAVRLQVILPLVSFVIFSMLPAGKKLFVIVTLSFSIIFSICRHLYHLLNKQFNPPQAELAVITDAPLAVESPAPLAEIPPPVPGENQPQATPSPEATPPSH